MTSLNSRIHSAEYLWSSPGSPLSRGQARGPSIPERLLQCRAMRNVRRVLGTRLRGDDTLRVYAASLALVLLICLIATDGFAASLPSHAGPELALPRPRDGYVGRLDVTPEHGPAGTEVTVSADQLPPNQEVQLVWRTVKGRWKGEGPEDQV